MKINGLIDIVYLIVTKLNTFGRGQFLLSILKVTDKCLCACVFGKCQHQKVKSCFCGFSFVRKLNTYVTLSKDFQGPPRICSIVFEALPKLGGVTSNKSLLSIAMEKLHVN